MTKIVSLLFVFVFLSLVSLSQTNTQTQKECRISTGIGFAGTTKNIKSIGPALWVQLDYKVLEDFSIAMEFENMAYKQPGYYIDLPVNPNDILVVNNNFSLLIKYYFPINKKLKIALASGWTYSIRANKYYIFEKDGTNQTLFPNVSAFSDYRIPFLAEIGYPLYKKINIEARLKYNLNPQNGDTYSGGIGQIVVRISVHKTNVHNWLYEEQIGTHLFLTASNFIFKVHCLFYWPVK